jgi:hypothetical protein
VTSGGRALRLHDAASSRSRQISRFIVANIRQNGEKKNPEPEYSRRGKRKKKMKLQFLRVFSIFTAYLLENGPCNVQGPCGRPSGLLLAVRGPCADLII